MTDDERTALLRVALGVAVPEWIEKLRHATPEDIRERAEACVDVIASQGDVILYESKKTGESAAAFNKLAEGLACVALCQGSVEFWGLEFVVPGEDEALLLRELASLEAGLAEVTAMHRDAVLDATTERVRSLDIRRAWQELREWAQDRPDVLHEMDALEGAEERP
jgi:hypothetical protein